MRLGWGDRSGLIEATSKEDDGADSPCCRLEPDCAAPWVAINASAEAARIAAQAIDLKVDFWIGIETRRNLLIKNLCLLLSKTKQTALQFRLLLAFRN
jgi:hypothetical protein